MTADVMDIDLGPEQFDLFAPTSEEERESGDGDSGGESKEITEFQNATSKVDAIGLENKNKDRLKSSRIPVRKVKNKIACTKQTLDDQGLDCVDNGVIFPELNHDLNSDSPELDCGCDKLPIFEEDVAKESDDSADDLLDSSAGNLTAVNMHSILEAPEEFRQHDSDGEEDASDRIHDDGRNHASTEKNDVPIKTNNDIVSGTESDVVLNEEECNEYESKSNDMVSSCAMEVPTKSMGIDADVEEFARASRCRSRVPTVEVNADQNQSAHLTWSFKNGRLCFFDPDDKISSRDLNRTPEETKSRLKHLETKLKEAGLLVEDETPSEQVVDHEEDIIPEADEEICQFSTTAFDNAQLLNNDNGCIRMGIDGERVKHNPDRENLKSLLKRPGKSKEKRPGSNRVVFNENKNEFFDADYIILIREECDYDDEEEDTVCTCNQHEMVRLQCCEPNCNCNYDSNYEQTPQSPKFAPPIEFVDAVTLSPPEGYKDMELEEQQLLALQQMARRGQQNRQQAVCKECSVTHDENETGDGEESQSDNEICGETNLDRDEDEKEKTDQSQQTTPTTPPNESSNSGNYLLESMTEQRIKEYEDERRSPNISGSPINGILKGGRLWKQTSFDTNNIAKQTADLQQESSSSITSDEESGGKRSVRFIESNRPKRDTCDGEEEKSEAKPENPPTNQSPESAATTEMMLTFKLGNHVLISNNSLKPNSAVRQLFPCTNKLTGKSEETPENIQQYLVTAESLRAFEEAKRSKLPQMIQSGENDESIKKAIERNTLRRSLIRYEPRNKKNVQKTDNSLVERIKQLTCDVDEEESRSSPPGEEASRISPLQNGTSKNIDKSFSPSSSSTASSSNSSNSSVSSTYKKITDLFGKKEKGELQPPDLGNGGSHLQEVGEMSLIRSNEARKQFLAPLTACVSAVGGHTAEDFYYQATGERTSLASSVGTEYSLEDIDEGLKNGDEESKKIAPDVLAGTPSASESGDELAMFVQQDASRIERIKKKYQPDSTRDEDDEHDDYGFNHRPSVRGIKPRFGTTTEILQQIQNQIQPRVAWPYYSESGLSDNTKTRNANQNPPVYPQYRPTSLQDENLYQNCANQRRTNNGRPQSPPPMDMSKTYHQTMVYIPYNHIDGYQPSYYQTSDFIRVSNHNQINKRYIDPCYQQEHVYVKPIRIPFARSESPQFSTARSTQTPSSCNYYRFRPLMVPATYQTDCTYVTKVNRHSVPAGHPRFPNPDSVSLTDSESSSALNGYMNFNQKESPTKQRFLERGVPEGAAASVPSQDSTTSSSTMTSPTSPQNPTPSTQKPLFYAMNV